MSSSTISDNLPEEIDSDHRLGSSNDLPTGSSWRHSISQKAAAAFESFKITSVLVAYLLFKALVRDSNEDTKRSIQKQRQQCLNPDPNPGQPLLTPISSSSLSALSSPLKYLSILWSSCRKKISGSIRYAIYLCLPHLLSALWICTIVQPQVHPRQDPQVCTARQNNLGFVGNSDFYGFGVCLGLYLQWIAAIFAIHFIPSARDYIASGYLLCHLGMIVAMCLLLLPVGCTYTAELSIILHFLWAGSALVLVPHQNQRTIYTSTSSYLGLEIVSVTIGSLIFLIASWFHLRLSVRDARDFLDTPGGTYLFSGILDVDLSTMGTDWRSQAIWTIWIFFATDDLLTILHDTPKKYLFSAIVTWCWSNSAAMVTGQLFGLCNYIYKAFCVLLYCIDLFVFLFSECLSIASGKGSDDTFEPGNFNSKYRLTFQMVMDFLIRCYALSTLLLLYLRLHRSANKLWSRYRLIRHLFVMAIAIRSIELTIQRNSISEVQSLDSTGQVMPLAIGTATVLSLLYMWARGFIKRGRGSVSGATSVTVGQPIGFPTASGTWI